MTSSVNVPAQKKNKLPTANCLQVYLHKTPLMFPDFRDIPQAYDIYSKKLYISFTWLEFFLKTKQFLLE